MRLSKYNLLVIQEQYELTKIQMTEILFCAMCIKYFRMKIVKPYKGSLHL